MGKILEYDVECDHHVLIYDGHGYPPRPVDHDGFYRVRTVRNLFYTEEIHIPASTYMSAREFLNIYEPVKG
jgi:hypothetical protein